MHRSTVFNINKIQYRSWVYLSYPSFNTQAVPKPDEEQRDLTPIHTISCQQAGVHTAPKILNSTTWSYASIFLSTMVSLYLGSTKSLLRGAAFEQSDFHYFYKFTILGNLDLQSINSLSEEVRELTNLDNYVLMCSLFHFPSTFLSTFCQDLREHMPNLRLVLSIIKNREMHCSLLSGQFEVCPFRGIQPFTSRNMHTFLSMYSLPTVIFAKWRRDLLCPFSLHLSLSHAHKRNTITQDWTLTLCRWSRQGDHILYPGRSLI